MLASIDDAPGHAISVLEYPLVFLSVLLWHRIVSFYHLVSSKWLASQYRGVDNHTPLLARHTFRSLRPFVYDIVITM